MPLARLRIHAALTHPFACVPFLYFHFRAHGVGLAEYAQSVTIYYLATMFADVPTGLLADRFGRRQALVVGELVLAAGFGLFALGTEFTTFCLGQAVVGLGQAILSGPPTALLYATLAADGREREFLGEESRMHALRLAGTALAFLLGGVVVWCLGIVAAIGLSIGLHLLSAAVAATLREPAMPATGARHPLLTAAVRDLLQPQVLWIGAYYCVVFWLLRYCFHTYQPYLEAAQEMHPLLVGTLFALLNLAAAPCSRLAPWLVRRLGFVAVLWMMPLLLSGSLALLSLHVNLLALPLLFLHQVPFGLHWALVQDFTQRRIRQEVRATVLSLVSFLGRGVFAATFPLLGALHQSHGISAAYLAAACAGTVATILVLARAPRDS
ncbi:MAG: MFS transporter [Planctomycetes bacterium]|nr:MFS transporter [Planctomycetota bacterium]